MVVRDVVCGMSIEETAVFATSAYKGKTYRFCSEVCRQHFERHPEWYASPERDPDAVENEKHEHTTDGQGPAMCAERWVIGLLGAWTMAVAALSPMHLLVGWSDLLAGVAVTSAGVSLARRRRVRGGLAAILGLWLAAAALLVPLHLGGGLASNNVIVGLAILLVGFIPYDRP